MVSEQIRHRPSSTGTEDGVRLDILDLESRGIALSIKRRQRAPIRFAVSAHLFSHNAKCWFSHDAAQLC